MKVFISHSTEDIKLVEDFVNILRLKGIDVYVAFSDVQAGSDLWKKLESNIKNSNYVLAILTQDGLRSEMVNQEVATANAFNIPVVPIVEKGVNLKGVLTGKEYIEFDKENPRLAYQHAERYLGQLKEQIEKKKFIGKLVLAGLGLWLLSQYSE